MFRPPVCCPLQWVDAVRIDLAQCLRLERHQRPVPDIRRRLGFWGPILCTATPTYFGDLVQLEHHKCSQRLVCRIVCGLQLGWEHLELGRQYHRQEPGDPTTSVVIPSNGATLSGSTVLDASASNATSVVFQIFGGVYGFWGPILCTATPTYFGYLCNWNTTHVPNGSYVVSSVASNSAGYTWSSGVNITVNN